MRGTSQQAANIKPKLGELLGQADWHQQCDCNPADNGRAGESPHKRFKVPWRWPKPHLSVLGLIHKLQCSVGP